MAVENQTASKLLETAERLFAAKGFSQTSLRNITSEAGVNLAAVNYHFGSKEALVQAVFQRFLDPFCDALSKQFGQLGEHQDAVSLEWLLGVLSALAVGNTAKEQQKAAVFFRLAGLAYTQSQEHLRSFFYQRYAALFRQFQTLLAKAVPNVPPMELFWRSHFALGSMMFTLQGLPSMQRFSTAEFGEELSLTEVVHRMLPFVAAGIRAPYFTE